MSLEIKKCTPCKTGTLPLKGKTLINLYLKLNSTLWLLKKEHHIERSFTLKSFPKSLSFVQDLGKIAEEEAHHPVLLINYNKVTVTIWTHKIDGLSENDFILASKYETHYQKHYS